MDVNDREQHMYVGRRLGAYQAPARADVRRRSDVRQQRNADQRNSLGLRDVHLRQHRAAGDRRYVISRAVPRSEEGVRQGASLGDQRRI